MASIQEFVFEMDTFIMKVTLWVHLLIDEKTVNYIFSLGFPLLKLKKFFVSYLFFVKLVFWGFFNQKLVLSIFFYLLKIIIFLKSLISIVLVLLYHLLYLNRCLWIDEMILIGFIAFSLMSFISSFILILFAYLLFPELILLILQLFHLQLFYFHLAFAFYLFKELKSRPLLKNFHFQCHYSCGFSPNNFNFNSSFD